MRNRYFGRFVGKMDNGNELQSGLSRDTTFQFSSRSPLEMWRFQTKTTNGQTNRRLKNCSNRFECEKGMFQSMKQFDVCCRCHRRRAFPIDFLISVPIFRGALVFFFILDAHRHLSVITYQQLNCFVSSFAQGISIRLYILRTSSLGTELYPGAAAAAAAAGP